MGELVRLECDEGIGTIVLDRPPLNVLSAQAQDELAAAATEAGARRDVHAVVVYGGPRVFAAGVDVTELAEWTDAEAVERSRGLQAAVTTVASVAKPTVAAVTGFALGGGCELALCCDVRVAGDNAKLGLPEIRLGIIPGAGGTQRLTRLVGPARAKDMIFTGRHVGAEEAYAMGLVDRVVAPDDVYAEARAWARQFVDGPRRALRAAKEAIDAGSQTDVTTGLEIERVLFASLFATHDARAGIAAFLRDGPGTAAFEGR